MTFSRNLFGIFWPFFNNIWYFCHRTINIHILKIKFASTRNSGSPFPTFYHTFHFFERSAGMSNVRLEFRTFGPDLERWRHGFRSCVAFLFFFRNSRWLMYYSFIINAVHSVWFYIVFTCFYIVFLLFIVSIWFDMVGKTLYVSYCYCHYHYFYDCHGDDHYHYFGGGAEFFKLSCFFEY